jgi:hypothetical protein
MTEDAQQPWGVRRMTPNEKASQISAYGDLVACETADCENQASYVAAAYGRTGFLCSECKDEFVRTMMNRTLPKLEGSEA